MSDNKRWFKVWNSMLTDPTFMITPLDNIGRWVLLGALMSLHGKNGTLHIEEESLKNILRMKNDNADDNKMITLALKNVSFMRDKNDNGKIIVTMKNWSKYQKDSTGYERVKRFRERLKDNGVREDKKKIRKEKEYNTDFLSFWNNYPNKIGKKKSFKDWLKAKDKPSIEMILQKLSEQIKSEQWTKDNGQYIPNPSTWINQGRWDDEPLKKSKWK